MVIKNAPVNRFLTKNWETFSVNGEKSNNF